MTAGAVLHCRTVHADCRVVRVDQNRCGFIKVKVEVVPAPKKGDRRGWTLSATRTSERSALCKIEVISVPEVGGSQTSGLDGGHNEVLVACRGTQGSRGDPQTVVPARLRGKPHQLLGLVAERVVGHLDPVENDRGLLLRHASFQDPAVLPFRILDSVRTTPKAVLYLVRALSCSQSGTKIVSNRQTPDRSLPRSEWTYLFETRRLPERAPRR